jgi:hypothetical protein
MPMVCGIFKSIFLLSDFGYTVPAATWSILAAFLEQVICRVPSEILDPYCACLGTVYPPRPPRKS